MNKKNTKIVLEPLSKKDYYVGIISFVFFIVLLFTILNCICGSN